VLCPILAVCTGCAAATHLECIHNRERRRAAGNPPSSYARTSSQSCRMERPLLPIPFIPGLWHPKFHPLSTSTAQFGVFLLVSQHKRPPVCHVMVSRIAPRHDHCVAAPWRRLGLGAIWNSVPEYGVRNIHDVIGWAIAKPVYSAREKTVLTVCLFDCVHY
jgi:hypothetical protein